MADKKNSSPILPNDLDGSSRRLKKLIDARLEISEQDAYEAGEIAYLGRIAVQASMPYSETSEPVWSRTAGRFSLTMQSGYQSVNGKAVPIGMPYGNIPRLLMLWISTEVVRTGKQELVLGSTLSEFMRQLDLVPTGGRWGSITRLRDQMKRLFASTIQYNYNDEESGQWANEVLNLGRANLWWDPQAPEQAGLFESTLNLNESFFNELNEHAVPVDMRAIKALRQSPMELDIYSWLTYRSSYTWTAGAPIPWDKLMSQFGNQYKRKVDFKRKFIEALKNVMVVYDGLKIAEAPDNKGLIIQPSSKPHVKMTASKRKDTDIIF